MQCPECDGGVPGDAGPCGASGSCDGQGRVWLTCCPALWAGEDALELLNMADDWKRGVLAMPGSRDDQPARLVGLIRFALMEMSRAEAAAITRATKER